MLVARYRAGGSDRLGAVDGDRIRPISRESLPAQDRVAELGTAVVTGDEAIETSLVLDDAIALDAVELLRPVPRPGKIICIGANYRSHAAGAGASVPTYPDVFAKFASALNDPGKPIKINPADLATDYEGELCVIIGRRASRIAVEHALDAVAGYTVANDVSARTWQLRVSQWVSGKSFDTFCPTGPWMATRSEIPDPQRLRLWTEVNGERLQEVSTADMVFSVANLVSHLSGVITLDPGDLILTGTPDGVGMNRRPQRFLTHGDTVAVSIERIGTLSNPVVSM
jgi:2-keto-4-pentenoate hydratase/2-oxohepta-3-ene-1,7-dioic acid hydratase in catechol pathway